jgi:hypothetical protein
MLASAKALTAAVLRKCMVVMDVPAEMNRIEVRMMNNR